MTVTQQFLNAQRSIGDSVADQLVADAFRSNQEQALYQLIRLSPHDLIKANTRSVVFDFLMGKRASPKWFDEKRILKGQTVFENHAVSIMSLLGVMALPYCYAAYPGNKALYLTEKMRKSPGKRLAETGEFTLGVLRKGNLQSELGHIHINKTRLIHAIARYYLQKGTWNSEWGVPINQEDMAGTNMAFSYVILAGLQQSGILLSDREKEDYIFVWKYIGFQLGIDEQLLPNSFQEARAMSEVIKSRTLRKTEEGITLTNELINYYKKVIPANQADFVESQMRYFLGNEVADYLGLPENSIKEKLTSFTNSWKEIQNIFSLPTNQLPQLMINFQELRQKIKAQGL